MNSSDTLQTALDQTSAAHGSRIVLWMPIAAAILYPWTLLAFHNAVVSHQGDGSIVAAAGAAVWLTIAFALPLSCLALAMANGTFMGVGPIDARARRMAFAGLAAPPLFVLTGVAAGLLHSPIRDRWLWPIAWFIAGIVASFAKPGEVPVVGRSTGRLRVVHGVTAVLILMFVTFHLFNHLMGLVGPELHARVMKIGRVVYRSTFVEPLLVGLLLFQVASGLRLAWRWSGRAADLARTIQVGSGAYLAAFILTHLNSAFISARAVHHIQTDWSWATGAPDGLIMDAWNIRLVPHYALGAFFVLAHLSCGLREVFLAHHVRPAIVQRVWLGGFAIALTLSAAITAGLCGLRI